MPKTYSMDLRQKVAKALDKGKSPDEVAQSLGVSRAWVYRLAQRRRDTGSLAPLARSGRPQKFPELPGQLRALLKKHPNATLQELLQALPMKVSSGTAHKVLQREGLALKRGRQKN